jgi:hypothetical protein
VRAPRGGDGAAYSHEGVARQVRGEGKIALLKGFVRQFLGKAGTNSKASRRQVGSCRSLLCSVHPERVCWHSFLGMFIHHH